MKVVVKKCEKGSQDPTSPWVLAHNNWVTQLLVRFNVAAADDSPPGFDHQNLPSLTLCDEICFDDKNEKCLSQTI